VRISFGPILYDFLLSTFFSSGKLKKHAEFAEHFFLELMVLRANAHIHMLLLLTINLKWRGTVTRSVPCNEGSLIEYRGENGKPTNIVMMTESESEKERERSKSAIDLTQAKHL